MLKYFILFDRVREVFMQLLPVLVQQCDLLVSLLAKSLPFDDLFVLFHHSLLRYSILLSKYPVLISHSKNDSLKAALIVMSLLLACTRQSVYAGFQILKLRFEDLIFCSQLFVLFDLVCFKVKSLDVILDVAQVFDPLLGLGKLRLDLF